MTCQVYPLSSTVTFFGILLSTAVLQLVITGTVFTLIIATFAALPELYSLLHEIVAFIIAWIVIAIVDTMVMQVNAICHTLIKHHNSLKFIRY